MERGPLPAGRTLGARAFLAGAALLALLLSLAGALWPGGRACAQMRPEEFERRMYDERGKPLPAPRGAACRRAFEEARAACVSRALQRPDLRPGDHSFYARCAEAARPALARCLAREAPGERPAKKPERRPEPR